MKTATDPSDRSEAVKDVLFGGPAEGEGFYRLKVTGRGESKWLNLDARALREVADSLEGHGGYRNGETFDVVAVSDNDRPLYDARKALAEAHAGEPLALADALKTFFERVVESRSESASLLRDTLVTTALGRVDWREIAENLLAEE